ncbi:NHLP family bacteriocin export ABC transporter peptidase/permease/ATPase subunit [Butyrivibrio sp. INlla16]|uniref:NHLP family bacteriocin export ABC transporter peptidase/permease/ATPase subunit n=1 Tax=Butyrivibrio sp. INlla16 TaxID=1520807 RepID=UPI00088B8B95|nr:NHLP family bacteriocin export ABC transporter peptidase/permease/ATPase subunit [Butyrivibrio sp. INlla16]SDB43783.1 NHLM bacteriocin system ABC transporter, peptidase/ATP-binding protein [Butyrivibrio sp. INlla16]
MTKENKLKQPVQGKVAKVPFIMQMEALECGAASLAMILAYYDKWIPLEQVRRDCGVSRDGSNALNIMRAARNYGLEATGYRYEPDYLRDNGTFPCIAHWEFNHFVVVDGFKNGKVYLNDPARGTVTLPFEEFDEKFTGLCVLFSPSEIFEPGGKPKSTFEFAKKRLVGCSVAIAFVIAMNIISSLIGIINPVFSRIFMDRLLTGKDPDWHIPFIIVMAAFGCIQLISQLISTIYSRRIDGKMSIYGTTSYMWKVLNLPMDFFSQRYAGDILSRRAGNASISNSLIYTFAPMALNTFMMVFYLVVMLKNSVILTMIGISSIVINMLISRIISARRVNISRIQMRDAGKLSSCTTAGIEMIETIKSSGAEDGYFQKWAGYQASVNTQKVKFAKLNQYLGSIPSLVSALTNTIVLAMGVYLVINGRFTIGMITAFQGFLSSFSAPASTFISTGQTMQELRTDMERIEDVMEYPEDDNGAARYTTGEGEYKKLSGEVEMKSVTFGYSKLADPLIKDFSLKLERGSRVAFVGESGCGKSTLSKLLSGLYSPWEGEILFDGRPMKDIDRSVFTGSLAVVDQDIIMFEDTISSNIRMWDDSIEEFEVIVAARDAQIHEDIMTRDGGYEYRMIEGGKDFSGGQRQRMEIARVLAQDPTIVILDEATSALDAKTEYDVVNAIKDRGITCIVIAHRLSTIRDCDEIIVLKHGEVVDRGTHEELYAKGGYYKELVQSE